MSVTIKRYPNRKLYNTETKRYITLDGIASLIQQGDEVAVVDHTSGEDLTTLTLTQIIFEQEKKSSGFLPKAVLTDLIQVGGEKLGSIRKTLTAPLELFGPVEAEIDRRLQILINRGELAREEGARLRGKMLGLDWLDFRPKVPMPPESLEAWLAEHNLPTSDDVKSLFAQLDVVTDKINNLLQTQEEAESAKQAESEPETSSST